LVLDKNLRGLANFEGFAPKENPKNTKHSQNTVFERSGTGAESAHLSATAPILMVPMFNLINRKGSGTFTRKSFARGKNLIGWTDI
jgi:hypothetical protein